MSSTRTVSTRDILILGLYLTGIIIGGGILALPFVARDTGLPLLIFFLVLFGVLFHIIYVRMLISIGEATRNVAKFHIGLELYDYALVDSGLEKYGKLAFTLGLTLYVLPADIVYMLYGMKSMVELSTIIGEIADTALLIIGALGIAITIASTIYTVQTKKKVLHPGTSLLLKILVMLFIWLIGIGSSGCVTGHAPKIILATTFFAVSLLVGEYFPEKLFKTYYDVDIHGIHPRHEVGAILTLIKIILILSIPIFALILILGITGRLVMPPLYPQSMESLVYSLTIIIFMYVGSGIYNILMYKWVARSVDTGKKVVLVATLISMLTYIIFTLIIIASVEPTILAQSDINREHSFIALSNQLEDLGLTIVGLITIIAANIFALVSVSVAYLGFTDTLADRFALEYNTQRWVSWIIITIGIATVTAMLDINNVARFATDALGVAGNAGGGLFILVLPWLFKCRGKRRVDLAVVFLVLVTILNVFLIISSMTLIAMVIAVISTVLVVLVGGLAIGEALRAP